MYYIKIFAFISLFCFSIITDAQTLFTKYDGNPVLRVGPPGSWESKQVSHPRIIFDGKKYQMWYAGSNDTCRQIGYALSTDGINWTKHTGNPVIKIGERGATDDLVVSPGAVVYDGTRYHMYYTARSYMNAGTICHAVSSDGISWTKDETNNPILTRGTAGWWDDYGLSAGPVLKQGTEWKMWYNGFRSDTRWHSGIATSSDGIHWIKDTLNNPLFEAGAAGTWDEYEQWISDVLTDSLYYEAFYFGNTKQRAIGYAVSKDGIAWGKYDENPILAPDHSTSEKAALFQSCVLKNGKEYKIWYSDGMTAQICLALSVAFTPASAQEQEKRMLAANKPVAGATKTTTAPKNEMKITYENGIKIVGEPTFDIRIKDGILNTASGKINYNGNARQDIANILKEFSGSEIPTNNDIKQIVYANDKVKGNVAYLILKHGIVFVAPEYKGGEQIGGTRCDDKTDVFTHTGAIFVAENGSIVASTPTTLLVLTPNDMWSISYTSRFGNASLPLQRPTISGGATPEIAVLRDPVLRDSNGAIKLEINLNTLRIDGVDDRLASLGELR